MITSNQNTKLKLARSLMGRSKERRENGAFVAEGVRLVEEALSAEWPFRFVLVSEALNARGRELVSALQTSNIPVEQVPGSLLDPVSGTESNQGILAVLDHASLAMPARLDFALIADQIRDPGNLGTLLRTAAATGVQVVFISPDTTDAFSPKVLRAGMGAHFRFPIFTLAWDDIRRQVDGLQVFLADMSAPISCWQADFKKPLAMIIGGEAEGASKEARTLATQAVFIPMMGNTESLNAGIAGAILLYEAFRQRINP